MEHRTKEVSLKITKKGKAFTSNQMAMRIKELSATTCNMVKACGCMPSTAGCPTPMEDAHIMQKINSKAYSEPTKGMVPASPFFNGETFECTFVYGQCSEFVERQAAVHSALCRRPCCFFSKLPPEQEPPPKQESEPNLLREPPPKQVPEPVLPPSLPPEPKLELKLIPEPEPKLLLKLEPVLSL
jgi:hypothetical protein